MIVKDKILKLSCTTITTEKINTVTMHISTNSKTSHGSQNHKGKKYDYSYFNGHTRKTCYSLIGYPNDWKQRRRGGYNGN